MQAFGDMYDSSDAGSVAHTDFIMPGWNEELYDIIYHVSLSLVFIFILPITVTMVLNVRLFLIVRGAHVQRKNLTNGVHNGVHQGRSPKISQTTSTASQNGCDRYPTD